MAKLPPRPIRFPQIGDPVHYRSFGSPDGTHMPACRPATVVEILIPNIEQCQLFIVNPTGVYFNACDHNEDYQEPGAGGTWHWPHLG